jgi:hypothetical protein
MEFYFAALLRQRPGDATFREGGTGGSMADLLPSLALAGLLWAAIVPPFCYLATSGLERRERLRLAFGVAGATVVWIGAVAAIAASALATGGREMMVAALMALMFLLFGVVALVRVRAGAANRSLMAQPHQARR